MIEQRHRLSHRPHRRLVESACEGEGAVLVHLAPEGGAEMIQKILRRRTQKREVREVTFGGRLAGCRVLSHVVVTLEPFAELPVQLPKRGRLGEERQKLGAHRQEEPLDRATAFRHVRPRVRQGHPERRARRRI